jgi:4-hydroxybenzoate polyprenyltransferase
MSAFKAYAGLLRIHHYIKNILIFIPLFFSVDFFNARALAVSALGFVIFSVLSSIVYILNDMRDIEKDRLHPVKRLRPLASGRIPASHARAALGVLAGTLVALTVMLCFMENRFTTWAAAGLLAAYLALNIGYSYGLKNIPLVDIIILASGYVIRVLFGALIIGISISVWLYLMITVGAFYLGLGKRRNEITGTGAETRAVMRFYSHNFLDKNMYMCQALCVIFYALWSIDAATVQRLHTGAFVYTIPLFLLLCAVYGVWAFCLIYLNRSVP